MLDLIRVRQPISHRASRSEQASVRRARNPQRCVIISYRCFQSARSAPATTPVTRDGAGTALVAAAAAAAVDARQRAASRMHRLVFFSSFRIVFIFLPRIDAANRANRSGECGGASTRQCGQSLMNVRRQRPAGIDRRRICGGERSTASATETAGCRSMRHLCFCLFRVAAHLLA